MNYFFFFAPANATYDGDKESEGEEDGVSSEDSRKVSIILFKCCTHSLNIYIDTSFLYFTFFLYSNVQKFVVSTIKKKK